MDVLQIIFYVAALILLVLAALGIGERRVQFGWAGLACWLIAEVFLKLLA